MLVVILLVLLVVFTIFPHALWLWGSVKTDETGFPLMG